MRAMDMTNEDGLYEYLILGGGPAGLQLGFFLQRSGRSYLILESGESPGTFFRKFPRHRQLISINKVSTGYDDPEINLRWDWNSLLGDGTEPLFKDHCRDYFPPADVMVEYLCDYARHYDLNIRYGSRAVRVEREDGFRVVDHQGRSYRAPCLIVATGLAEPYVPPIPGIELAENYVAMSVDPEGYRDQHVLILGKGNSGFETADGLIPTAAVIHIASPEPVRLAWKSHYVGHLRAVNNNFLDTYQLKSQNAVLDCTVEQIERRGDGKLVVSVVYTHAGGETEQLVYDRVLCCTGFRADTSIFAPSAAPELAIDGRFPKLTSAWESTNVSGLYFAGSVMQMRDFKKHTSGFIHGFRYNIRTLYKLLEQRYHGHELPSARVDAAPDALSDAVLARVNRTSALWQQFGMLCDLIVMPHNGGGALYYEELPIDYVRDSGLGRHARYFTVSLEFGKSRDDPFNVVRHPHPDRAAESFFLHPVVRYFRGSRQIAEHHMLEDLYGEWKEKEVHRDPLHQFLSEQLAGPSVEGPSPGPVSARNGGQRRASAR